MPVRKPNLEEWFLIHQLSHVSRTHFHLPFSMEIDVSALHFAYQNQGSQANWTAILTRAAGLLLEKHPEANRVVFRTVFGDRILEPSYIAVNLPVMLQGKSSRHLNAAIIRDAHIKTVKQIKEEIKQSVSRDPQKTLMGPMVYEKTNNFFNRLRLRLVHFYASNFPKAYEKFGGGGISVSSIMNAHDGISQLQIQAFGQTGFTLGLSSVVVASGRAIMRLGIAYDHFAFSGEEAALFSNTLSKILRGDDSVAFKSLIPEASKPTSLESDHRPQL